MSLWKIRIAISNDPRCMERFTEALAGQPVSSVRLTANGTRSASDIADMTGEVLVELAQDESLATMLGALHGISPQIFVSRAEPEELARS